GSLHSSVTSAVFSPDGARVATGGAGDKIVNVWDTETGRLVQAFGEAEPGYMYGVRLAFSPDGARILTGGSTSLKLGDAAKGTPVRTLASPRDPDGSRFSGAPFVAFSQDGSLVLSSDYASGLKFWSTETGQLVRTVEPKFGFVAVSS